MALPNIINYINSLENVHDEDMSNFDSKLSSQIQNIQNTYLSLNGGEMNGHIDFLPRENIIRNKSTTNGIISVYSSYNFIDGGWLSLFGKDLNNDYAGAFRLGAGNGASSSLLHGFPDGRLIWNGQNIVCVKTWKNGTSWYRKYSDGWIEQGGMISGKSGMTTISFNIGFTDINYTILKTLHWNENSGGTINRIYFGFHNRTLTTAMTYTYTTLASHREMWYACGY